MAEARCPYCLASLHGASDDEDVVVACATCGTEHHRGCFLEHGRCTVLGCRAARFRADAGAARIVGSLHPFLPVGAQRLPRSAGFLSVQPPEVQRVRRTTPGLRLALPRVAVVGRPLAGTVVVEATEPVRGQGLRLRVETLLHGPRGPEVLRLEEAALVGGAARPWLEQVRLWSRPVRGLLLARGRTTFRFTLHPDRLRWRGRLPAGAALGPRQTLVITAELDADRALRSAPCRVALADGRPAPPSVAAAGHEGLAPPPLGRGVPRAWTPCPVRVSHDPEGIAAVAAVRRRRGPRPDDDVPRADEIDLRLAPLAPGAPLLRGEVTLRLHAPVQPGSLVLEVTTDRRRLLDHDWVVYAREEVVLAGPSLPGEDVRGRHVLAFEHAPGPAFRARGRDHRRLRVRALVLGAGLTLASREAEVVLGPVRRRRAPTR